MINKLNKPIEMKGFLTALFICALSGLQANTANFNANQVCYGTATNLQSTSTASGGHSIVAYRWDFDGDSIFDAFGSQVNHVFPGAGTYEVLHQIQTSGGFIANIRKTITVNPNPTASFTAASFCLGDITSFSAIASVSSGVISTFEWELNGNAQFDDATGSNVSHSFPAAGYYNVGLKVTTDNACTFITHNVVTITSNPIVNFDFENQCIGSEVEFVNQTVNHTSSVSYTWTLGDGSTSTSTNPTHLYNSVGAYTVKLVAETPNACKDSISKQLRIFAVPTSNFTTEHVCNGSSTNFQNLSQTNGGDLFHYIWNFGDGETAVNLNQNQTHKYNYVDSFWVELVIITTDGCTDTSGNWAEVYSNPILPITADGTTDFCNGKSVKLSVDADTNTYVAWSSGETTNEITVTVSGLFKVLLYTDNNCTHRDSMEVFVRMPSSLVISKDTTISVGHEAELEVSGAFSYEWTGPNMIFGEYSDRLTVAPTAAENSYTVKALNQYGCESSASVKVFTSADFLLTPMNLFTPDGNGKNDFWIINNIENYPDCEIHIFDVWGKNVYTTKAYSNNWDGTNIKGEQLPEGTYYYIIDCPGNTRKFDGHLTLLRINR
jgi:gliding motility-associated-like protein